MGRHHRPASGSRASVERIVGSGSEPRYLPLTNTSFEGLVLYFFGAASRVEAVPTITTRAIAVFVNMVGSPVCRGAHSLLMCVTPAKHYAGSGSMILSLGAWALGTVWTIVLSQWHWLDRSTGRYRENNSLRVVATNNREWRRKTISLR